MNSKPQLDIMLEFAEFKQSEWDESEIAGNGGSLQMRLIRLVLNLIRIIR